MDKKLFDVKRSTYFAELIMQPIELPVPIHTGIRKIVGCGKARRAPTRTNVVVAAYMAVTAGAIYAKVVGRLKYFKEFRT
ncbi:hypothetical protein TELCIR_00642 [Teladorsagia circumcincta]|uniref:Uncharacterized protein n=1 Tax=Teladorsagia circumcincta TaxID=45464 RepID=A0A2G9V4E4_TELCI|nr:hypothetical protein TELCIR_00642 [Teladorsagia circumcincta]